MNDPLQRSGGQQPGGLFPTSTSHAAGQQAALGAGQWRERILRRLEEQPSALFEVAAHYGVPDHVISGRFTELSKDGHIERSGDRRTKPETGCQADVWRIRRARPDAPETSLVDRLGYPLTLRIGADLYDRQELLPAEGYPGFPYARRADTGGVRLNVRVSVVECPGCGKPLFLVDEGRSASNGPKLVRCGAADCLKTWRGTFVSAPGKAQMLALVMERH